METKAVRLGVSFTLNVVYPKKYKDDVETALWAWKTFGGIGARTRRGFGALQLLSINGELISLPSHSQVEAQLRSKVKQIKGQWPDGVHHLEPDMLLKITRKFQDSLKAWQDLIEALQGFRQKRHSKYGLSLWPEANVIRVRMRRSPKWPKAIRNPKLVKKFPRGEFGLPIIFHMPHDKGLPTDFFTLQGKPAPHSEKPIDRLASPLILRPLVCKDGAVGLAAVLQGPHTPPYGLEVDSFPSANKDVDSRLLASEAGTEPLKRVLSGQSDVLRAFLDYL
jgi:CRISPR-associated protein Cmr1